MSLIKQLIPSRSAVKFTPASSEVDWTRVETLVHGPGAGEDKRTINSAVFACLMAIATSYPEPPLVVRRGYKSSGSVDARSDSPLQKLLDKPTPNGELSIQELLFWTAWAKHIDGNAYWLKVRSGDERTGNVVSLWPVSPTTMEPVTVKDSGDWISYYKYRIAPNEVVAVPVENVIHFRLGLDDHDMRRGIAPLKALIRQIATDDEADKFTAQLLKNYAVPGLVVIPAQGTSLKEDDADRITAKLRQKFGNDNRGNIAVMSKESTIEQFGFSPKDLDLSVLHRIPEERISAVMGVPAIVAGLGAGLDRATYANFRESREMFTEQKLIPEWRVDADKLNTSLKPDFTSNPQIFIEFDTTDVRALQEDEDNKYTRLKSAVGKAWMTRNEARADIGMDPIDGWDEEDIAKPEPVPEPLQEFQGQQEGDNEQPEPEDEPTKSIALNQWRRKATRAVKAGKSAAVEFESDILSPVLSAAISGALEGAKTDKDVQRVFASTWMGYP